MTTAELFAWGIPAILVPLPTAAADHQTTNAQTLERAGAAICISQVHLTVDRLDATVRGLLDAPNTLADLAANATARARPHAAEEIATRILAIVDAGAAGDRRFG
jgi:UDP-N-acetylglucosamine--N-acetylmuramyl-(pentapeptide) pyrophosphoryl-undecaprenol N-acetylglucosamine transferase